MPSKNVKSEKASATKTATTAREFTVIETVIPETETPVVVVTPSTYSIPKEFVKIRFDARIGISNTRLNKSVSRETEDQKGAVRGSVNTSVQLFPAGELVPFGTFKQTGNKVLSSKSTCSPCGKWRIISVHDYADIRAALENVRSQWNQYASELLPRYQEAVNTARAMLGEMFNEELYRTRDEMERLLSFDIYVDSDYEQDTWIQNEINTSRQLAFDEGKSAAYREACERIFGSIDKPSPACPGVALEKQLAKGKDCATKSPVLESIKRQCEVIRSLNAVYNDSNITSMVTQLEQLFVTPEGNKITAIDLRNSEEKRKIVSDKLASIKAKFNV